MDGCGYHATCAVSPLTGVGVGVIWISRSSSHDLIHPAPPATKASCGVRKAFPCPGGPGYRAHPHFSSSAILALAAFAGCARSGRCSADDEDSETGNRMVVAGAIRRKPSSAGTRQSTSGNGQAN